MNQEDNNQEPVFIIAAKRTPIGSFNGALASLTASQLGAVAIRASLDAIAAKPETMDEVIMGCVLPAGLGQAPARQATLGAGLPTKVGAMTINKVCGSGMKAVMLARDLIQAGSAAAIVAGGMESMSQAPYLLNRARNGYRMGHGEILDHMMLDGLENAYDGQSMGCFAQSTADKENIGREAMDAFSLRSLSRANAASENAAFNDEIVPLKLSQKGGELTFDKDEGPSRARPEKIPHLKPAFKKDGTVTAANSSSISDGAAALILCSKSFSQQNDCSPLAQIVAHSTHALAPEEFTVAPIGAIEKVLQNAGWKKDDVDLFEINEAFAMVTMLAMEKLKLDPDKVNVNGGACALGHPIGASGARIIVTLIHALRKRGLRRGVACLCIGGGEATAVAIEIV